MPLKDLLKKKDKGGHDEIPGPATPPPTVTEFKFVRTDAQTEETIVPPHSDDDREINPLVDEDTSSPESKKKRFSRFRKGSTASPKADGDPPREHRRLSQRLNITRAASSSSVNVPADLPTIPDSADQASKEAKWEERATILAKENQSSHPSRTNLANLTVEGSQPRSTSPARSLSDQQGDLNIQEAIRLHESGQLEQATCMFHSLADNGNVLSQLLYGLSLRHGWGCTADPTRAVTYLSSAASNSAQIEEEALKSGMKKGGAAKGELVIAIFELANCFRHGWGVEVDKVAARQYYETAANLGDTDAMNEAAWCYLEGFGGKKDKFKAAQLLRLAETNGSKTLGNSWIWKEKYDPTARR